MIMKVKDFERIENIIEETKEMYIDNAWTLDRLGSEQYKAFVIRSKTNKHCAIVFDTVEEFERWIKG